MPGRAGFDPDPEPSIWLGSPEENVWLGSPEERTGGVFAGEAVAIPGGTRRMPMTRRGPQPQLHPQAAYAGGTRRNPMTRRLGSPEERHMIGDPNIHSHRSIFGRSLNGMGQGPIWAAAGYGAADPSLDCAMQGGTYDSKTGICAPPTTAQTAMRNLWRVGALAAGAALIYHGYKRHNGSVGWGLVWGLLGGIVWPVTLPIAYAQGFGKPKKK